MTDNIILVESTVEELSTIVIGIENDVSIEAVVDYDLDMNYDIEMSCDVYSYVEESIGIGIEI
jgi:hypothetical protein